MLHGHVPADRDRPAHILQSPGASLRRPLNLSLSFCLSVSATLPLSAGAHVRLSSPQGFLRMSISAQ